MDETTTTEEPDAAPSTDDADSASTGSEDDDTTEEDALPTGSVSQFEAAIEASYFQQAIDAASAVVDECRVHLCEDSLAIRAVDPANVAMVDEHVSAEMFAAYNTDCGVIGVNLERLDEVVGLADNDDDLVQFDIDAKTRKLEVQVNAVEYTLALIDPDAIRSEPDIPDLDIPAEISIEQADFKRAIRAADMVSDHIRFRVDDHDECFMAEAEGDTDNVELELAADDLEESFFHEADSLFSLDYLKDLRKPIPKDTLVQMELGTEFPVMLTFEMGDGNVKIKYLVAPRIQNH